MSNSRKVNTSIHFPEDFYDKESGRTFQAIRIQDLKEANCKCGNCKHFGVNHLNQTVCFPKEQRRVAHYNICQYHEFPHNRKGE